MIEFQKPDDPAALAVDLANTWDLLLSEPELMPDVESLRTFLAEHGFEADARNADGRTLADVHAVRETLLAVFRAPDPESAVDLLNRMLRDAGALPQLERERGKWTLRYTDADAPVSKRIAALSAMAMLDVIREDGWERMGICTASPCRCVFVDRSRNRSRRFCCHLCADRFAQAAYRERRRLQRSR